MMHRDISNTSKSKTRASGAIRRIGDFDRRYLPERHSREERARQLGSMSEKDRAKAIVRQFFDDLRQARSGRSGGAS
jgi:hypothetical protein